MIAGVVWFCSFWLAYIYFFCDFVIYRYCVICLGSCIIYFMIFLSYILSVWIIYYWFSSTCYSHIIQRICFFNFFCVATPAYVSVLFRFFCQIFFLCPHEASSFFHSFLFSFSHTFVTLTSLFWLSITKSNACASLSSSYSSFNSRPSILFYLFSCCSVFNFLNTFFSF